MFLQSIDFINIFPLKIGQKKVPHWRPIKQGGGVGEGYLDKDKTRAEFLNICFPKTFCLVLFYSLHLSNIQKKNCVLI